MSNTWFSFGSWFLAPGSNKKPASILITYQPIYHGWSGLALLVSAVACKVLSKERMQPTIEVIERLAPMVSTC